MSIPTHVWFLPHMWKFWKSVVIPTHVWFLPSNQNEIQICFLQNCCLFLNRSLSQYSNLIFIFEFFGSLSTKTMLLHKFCFWYGNTILFYILYLDARFLKMSSIEMIRSNKETLQWLKEISWNDSGETHRIGRFLFWCCEDK